jgi:triosephosphate isomerase
MKDLLIVGNWKENKTVAQSLGFMAEFKKACEPRENVKVIICSPFTSVSAILQYIRDNSLIVDVGVQNISEHEEGAYTGEIAAKQAAEFAKFVIVGHSERRRMLGETDEQVAKKVEMAIKYGITPIVCVINDKVPVPKGTKIVAYEPIEAIGTGNPDTPENAERVAVSIKDKNTNVMYVLYGGSVSSANVKGFTDMIDISGVLVGGGSLDPQEFSSIIKNA